VKHYIISEKQLRDVAAGFAPLSSKVFKLSDLPELKRLKPEEVLEVGKQLLASRKYAITEGGLGEYMLDMIDAIMGKLGVPE